MIYSIVLSVQVHGEGDFIFYAQAVAVGFENAVRHAHQLMVHYGEIRRVKSSDLPTFETTLKGLGSTPAPNHYAYTTIGPDTVQINMVGKEELTTRGMETLNLRLGELEIIQMALSTLENRQRDKLWAAADGQNNMSANSRRVYEYRRDMCRSLGKYVASVIDERRNKLNRRHDNAPQTEDGI